MSQEKKCMVCGTDKSENWIERSNAIGKKAYFCSKEHYIQYKKESAAKGVCEFC